MDIRKADIKEIKQGLKSKDPMERKLAGIAAKRIRNEDGWTKTAREALVRETRLGNKGNAWQIRDDIVRRRGGRQNRKSSTAIIGFGSMNYAPGQYETIFKR